MILRVVIAGQSSRVRERIARLIASEEVLLTPAPSLRRLLASPETLTCDVIVVAATSVDPDPAEVLEGASLLLDRPDVVCLTEGLDRSGEAHLLKGGAISVLPLDLDDDELAGALRSVLDRRRGLRRPMRAQLVTPRQPEPLNFAMLELLALSDRVASGDASVLILGETGTGKEWLARRIHASSERSSGPFVPVNCAALPEGLIESELFGHTKGAFTGAVRAKRGHFELAHGGTLFLDEIGDVSPAVQVRLLRALQDRTVQPVGSEKSIQVDVRVVAATNRRLDEAVADGTLRQDLYYRLAVITLNLPPLRERPEDIPALAETYAAHFARQLGRPAPVISEDALDALCRHEWPGNVRELINVLERAVLLSTEPVVGRADLPVGLGSDRERARRAADGAEHVGPPSPPTRYVDARARALADFDARFLTALLQSTGGRVGLAAKRADMNPRTLYAKMKAIGLRKEDFKE